MYITTLGPTRGRRPPGLGAPGPGVRENEITAVPETEIAALPARLFVYLVSQSLSHFVYLSSRARRAARACGTTTSGPGAPAAFRTWGPVGRRLFVRQPGLTLRRRPRRYGRPAAPESPLAFQAFLPLDRGNDCGAGLSGGGACPGAWKRMRSFAAPATPASKSEEGSHEGLHESSPGRSPPSIVQPGRRCGERGDKDRTRPRRPSGPATPGSPLVKATGSKGSVDAAAATSACILNLEATIGPFLFVFFWR